MTKLFARCFVLSLTALLPLTGAALAGDPPDLSCESLRGAIGAPVSGLIAIEDPATGPGWQAGADELRLTCTWGTDAAARATRGETLSKPDYEDLALITAQVAVYEAPLSQKDAAGLGMAHDPGAGPAGAWLFALKTPDPQAKLGLLMPELRYENLGVTVSGSRVLGESARTLDGLNLQWSLDAALRILQIAQPG